MIDMSIVLQKFMKRIEENIDSFKNIDDLVRIVRENTDRLGLDIIEEYMQWLECEIKGSMLRKKEWGVVRKGDDKVLLTEGGALYFSRTYYKSKITGNYRYLLDECMGISSHQRLDNGYKDKLVDEATEKSYEKTTATTGRVKVSKQTVKCAIHDFETDMIKHEIIPEKKKMVNYLYIDADEDHVSLLGGKNGHQKLMYVYEGKTGSAKRKELINPYYITGTAGSQMFEEAFEYISNNYDFNHIERIYIQGDGAPWIRNGVNLIPNSRFVLDRFHIWKHAKKCAGKDKELRAGLWNALVRADHGELDVVMNEILEKPGADEEEIIKDFKYFYNNFDGIEIYTNPDERPCGCSAEGHVSHVLSQRLSSRPLTWSRKGSDNMARLRVCKQNGGNITDIRKKQAYVREIEKNQQRRNRYMTDGHGMMYDEYHNIEVLNIGKRTQLYKILQNLRGAG